MLYCCALDSNSYGNHSGRKHEGFDGAGSSGGIQPTVWRQPEEAAQDHHEEGNKLMRKTPKPPPTASADHDLMTDKELCELLRISPVTLRVHLRVGPPRTRRPDAGDIRLIRHVHVCGKRRWVRSSVMDFIAGK